MSKTYRVRTQVGVDRQVNIEIDQDFEQLEILSLKVRSEEIYTRMCADYGVIVGRVVANGGYGVPNVRLSVFIPLTDDDANDEIISSLYPYKNVNTDVNDDGYRYNLLPYVQQHTGHVPTGTFPTREDVLTNPALIEVYDKYYKFTVKTNGSGDYMVMGVPIGTYTLVMDMDLSDIGPFSLSPQDLVRMGRATADQIDGGTFKNSTNLYELPQIVNINQTVNVEPFWGQPEICQVSIARHDFDLRKAGIEIKPTSIFMGSLVTGVNDESITKNCKPPRDMGNLCNLQTGPGEIIGIRQTIYQDTDGKPILERATLPRGGKVIDADGTWLMEVPMNLDYVTTNEFGETIFSKDPSIGIPTKGKYRFKIKYAQPANFETNEIRRGYFLVPNIKEYGWTNSISDPYYSVNVLGTPYKQVLGSYYFGLDWSGYTNPQEAIECKDTFYEFQYNKVYTVAGLIDQFKKGTNRSKFIGIKEITDPSCASENNRFPATDGVRNFDFFVFLVNNLILPIFSMLLIVLAPILHVLSIVWQILKPVIAFIYGSLLLIISGICNFINWLGADLTCPESKSFSDIFDMLGNPFVKITLPNLSYPDCQACDCTSEPVPADNEQANLVKNASQQNSTSLNADFFTISNWGVSINEHRQVFAGQADDNWAIRTPIRNVDKNDYDFIDNLPPWEVINKFNLKSKYFDTDKYAGSNRIKVQVEPYINPTKNHFDNIMAVFVDPNTESYFPSGKLISFSQPNLSKDPNFSGYTTGRTTGITGTTNIGGSVTVNFANPSNSISGSSVTYSLSGSTSGTTKEYRFPTDIEYFQVITGLTYNEFIKQNSNTLSTSLLNQLQQQIKLYRKNGQEGVDTYTNYLNEWSGGNLNIVFMVRGVDPQSGRKKIKYDLSRIFGYNTYGNKTIEGDFFLNIPVQPGLKTVRHNLLTANTDIQDGHYLYYPSYQYTAGTQYSAYTTTLQSYYSSLDASQIGNYKPTTSNGSSLLTTTMAKPALPQQQELIGYSYSPSGIAYGSGGEYIEGGSFIWYGFYSFNKNGGNNNLKPQYYYAPSWASSPTKMIVYSNRMVMRADRLPTGTVLNTVDNNVFAWQASNSLTYNFYSDSGSAETVIPTPSFSFGDKTGGADVVTGGTMNKVLESFSCAGMVDLNCYQGVGTDFTVLPATNDCNTNLGGPAVVNGCYSIVNQPLVSLFGRNNDFTLIAQWVSRFRLTFAICRGALSHTFVNAWVNGTLFAFPFENNVFFDSNNKPYVRTVNPSNGNVTYTFCADVLVFDPQSSNYYYRSSPWNGSDFIGKDSPTNSSNDVNKKDFLFPTTILDLGPKYIWTKDVNLSPEYYGYQMDNFTATSWSSEKDLLQLFIISRLVNANYLSEIFGVGNGSVSSLFSRNEDRVDGDYAQMLQINSQYGIVPFTAENYVDDPNTTADNPIYVSGDADGNPVFGVFYSGFTQDRDLISPRRLDRNLTGSTLIADYLGTKSQEVPFHTWYNNGWGSPSQPSIFGNQENTWSTAKFTYSAYKQKYQSIDRLKPLMFIGGTQYIQNLTGYIFQRDAQGGNKAAIVTGTLNQTTLTSAPWYFYFGLKKGASAMDKFTQLYIGTTE
jgi:hypothetical protein